MVRDRSCSPDIESMSQIFPPTRPIEGVPPSLVQALIPMLEGGRRRFGAAAASLTWGIDGADPGILRAGIDGELMTAGVLERWVKLRDDAVVVHSVGWPGSISDTDHLLIVGSRVYLVDSKRWKEKRTYSFAQDFQIKRGTVKFDGGDVHMSAAISSWKKVLPAEVKVYGIVVIAQDEVSVKKDNLWWKAPFRLVTAEDLESFLDDDVDKMPDREKGFVDADTIATIVSRAIKPRDRRREIINVDGVNA